MEGESPTLIFHMSFYHKVEKVSYFYNGFLRELPQMHLCLPL